MPDKASSGLLACHSTRPLFIRHGSSSALVACSLQYPVGTDQLPSIVTIRPFFAARRASGFMCTMQITPEVHRELDASRNRGEKPSDADVAAAAATARKPGAGGENPRDLPPVMLMDED